MIRHSAINLFGGVLPAVISLACIPLILQQHGKEFFGIYSIQTALLMVTGLMDLGLSRGIMLVTYDKALNPSGTPNKPFKAGMQLTQWVAVSIFVIAISILAIIDFFHHASVEVKISTLLCVVSGVLTIITLPLRALLEIQGKFGSLNFIRATLACSIPIAPLLPNLVEFHILISSSIYVLVIRFFGLWAYRLACEIPILALEKISKPTNGWQRDFLRRCGWVGLTNIGSIILTYADRFLLASLASANAIASFVVAHELATKIWMATGAIMSATMPKIAADLMKQEMSAGSSVAIPLSLTRVRILILVTIVGPSLVLSLFAEHVLRIWLGSAYHEDIEVAVKILIAGIALNSMSQLNFGLLQLHNGESRGAKLQFFNIILASILMVALIPNYGSIGAAAALSIRLIIDSFATRALLVRQTSSKAGFSYLDLTIAVFIFSNLLMIKNV